MPTYVLMTKLASYQDPRGRRGAGREWLDKVERVAPEVRFLAHYALLGPYDFMDVYEAPNAEIAFRVSMLSRELGAVTAESWPALEYERYLDAAADDVDRAARKNGHAKREKGAKREKRAEPARR